MDTDKLRSEFENRKRLFKSLDEEATFILEEAIKQAKIKTHSIISRVKNIDSFLQKILVKQSKKPFDDIQDIVGLRVVCLFLSDIPRVGQVIRNSFDVVSEDDKIDGSEINSFGYMSIHYIAQLPKECSGPRYKGITKIPFEIQVRTILMDAWANVSHYLAYKTDTDVPRNLKRDFHALSGLFYVADSHFETFFKSSKDSKIQLESASKPELARQEINLDSLTAYLHTRFPDRQIPDARTVSQLVRQLSESGYKAIQQIDEMLDRTDVAFAAYEKTSRPISSPFTAVGIVRISCAMYDEQFARRGGIYVKDEFAKLVKYAKSSNVSTSDK